MAIDYQSLRINGIYKQDDEGRLMMRVKLPAGVISCNQATQVADLADRFAGGRLHLTTRGSIELHDLLFENIETIRREMASVGLTSRGACGGAVRGVSCSTSFKPGFDTAQWLSRLIHRHFTGNPFFEGLPKKFKIAVEAGYEGGRHLIQDVGLVITDPDGLKFDVWVAGGLGVQPTPGFLLRNNVSKEEILPLLESIIRVYALHTKPPKRLKHMVAQIGREEFRHRLHLEEKKRLPLTAVLEDEPAPIASETTGVEYHLFAGELSGDDLRRFAVTAAPFSPFFVVNTDQNMVAVSPPADEQALRDSFQTAGFVEATDEIRFRICPGNHECHKGLAPTRDLAQGLLDQLPKSLANTTLAFSGCPNSCAQPQLAEYGIGTTRVRKTDQGREPLFTLFHRTSDAWGEVVLKDVAWDKLVEYLGKLA